ncbi:MAG TPA: CAP domain-containing protein [Pyrinomonadaceae bacterium]|nr:CAP domain-containing protein [Pyrinomonadaceae bacterium]
MKSSLALVFLTLTFFCASNVAQTRASINFDLRPDAVSTSNLTGSTRSRVTNISNDSRIPSAESIERQIFVLINAERVRNGLTELEWSDNLAAVARLHSDDMASAKFFSHRGSDGSMVDDRADRLGLGAWRSIGENIAYMRGFEDPAGLAVSKWLESAAHRKNLLGATWKESAVGVAVTDDGTYYMTEVFLLRK